MPIDIHTAAEVQRLAGAGAQIVEVLPEREYREQHLPGAINIPVRDLDARGKELLDPSRDVVVYCWDVACDLSPRAAWRLEDLGFDRAYDYVPGKLDWLALGLPVEGSKANEPTAGSRARRVPTCRPGDLIAGVKGKLDGSQVVVVTNAHDVVAGVLRPDLVPGPDDDRRAGEVMETGPSTFRPHIPIEEMAEHMQHRDMEFAIVSRSNGTLLGVLYREEIRKPTNG